MFSRYFGHYLLNRNLVAPEKIADALNYLDSVRVKLGVLAINAGFMSAGQVREIQQLQAKVDKKFGELAIEKGYLTPPQLEELLAVQRQGHLLLSQALLDKDYLSLEQLETALNEYVDEYGLSETQLSALEEGDIEEIVKAFVDFGTCPLKNQYTDYLCLMIRSVLRFIDDTPWLECCQVVKQYHAPWLVFQEIFGPVNIFTGIAGSQEVLTSLAGRFAGESFSQFNKLARASISEFLNLHNGVFLVNMSNNGIELEMKPQQTLEGKTLVGLEKGFVIPIFISDGHFDLILSQVTPSFLS